MAMQARQRIPLDTWMVVEPITYNEMKPVSTHATQNEAEAECDRRNSALGKPRYSVCMAFEPIAERMGRPVGR
ncbi:MAG: hypothetical protein ABW200_06480 [Hyphomicrobiaceae bacterium]|jgi:hypothetical protein